MSLETDYRVTSKLSKSSINSVYEQIIEDLKLAQSNLSDDFSSSGTERVRPNKWAATAMLARVYLYRKDWSNAENEATKIIDNSNLFKLTLLKDVFLKNSTESIWQLNNNSFNTNEASTFTFVSRPTNAALYQSFYNAFESEDQRRSIWIIPKVSAGITYYQISKYKAGRIPPITAPVTQPIEYSVVLRLAEQFLIRAEARGYLGRITGTSSAEEDINAIRGRAALKKITIISMVDVLAQIEEQRRFELFAEWGHRWLDLKRLPSILTPANQDASRADDILQLLKPSWRKEWKLYPIPNSQLMRNPAMLDHQNPGYN